MTQRKKSVTWESWNYKADQYLNIILGSSSMGDGEHSETWGLTDFEDSERGGIHPLGPAEEFIIQNPSIHTPIGVYPADSMLKPSDKWDCWLGYTNFPITYSIRNILRDDIEGIEALKVCGKYTFFIGIAKMFEISEVRKQIISKICTYTEEELLSNDDVEYTVEMLKDQLKDNTHWSILVSPQGAIEYIVSSSIDSVYLNKLSKLIEKKNIGGGIILRSERG